MHTANESFTLQVNAAASFIQTSSAIAANAYRGRHARVVRGQMFGAQLLLSGRVSLLLLVAHQMGDARLLR
jgi:hypothetical protein